MIRLTAVGEKQAGKAWESRERRVVIGRQPGCEVFLSDPEVSRLHAEIEVTPQGAIIRDLGSLNGTLVNGEKIAGPLVLVPGSRITVGDTELLFEQVAEAPRLSPVAIAIGGVALLLVVAAAILGLGSSLSRSQILFVSDRDVGLGGAGPWVFVMNDRGGDLQVLARNRAANLEPAWRNDHRKLAFVSNLAGGFDLYQMLPSGSKPELATLLSGFGNCRFPDWSRGSDGILFASDRDGDFELYLLPEGEGVPRQLTENTWNDWEPAWSPDGSYIVFTSDRDGDFEIYKMEPFLGAPVQQLTFTDVEDRGPRWSPDGSTIVFYSNRGLTNDIYLMDASGGDQRPLVTTLGDDVDPTWSPDGTRIGFASNFETGLTTHEIYTVLLTPAERRGERIRLTQDTYDDRYPRWYR